MRTEDLQIGDWVTSRKWREKPFQITRINEANKFFCGNTGDTHVGPFLIEELEPIPLTPEILEKNFQEFLPGINLMYHLKGPYCAMDEDGQWVFGLVKVDGENSARYPLVKISFVHELQHALRLCGIEKEIQI